jgi:hypothetical protein
MGVTLFFFNGRLGLARGYYIPVKHVDTIRMMKGQIYHHPQKSTRLPTGVTRVICTNLVKINKSSFYHNYLENAFILG